jgi:predicted HTH transcriptional regulator
LNLLAIGLKVGAALGVHLQSSPNTTPKQIDLWRTSPSETEKLEFKEAKNQFDNTTLFQYCVAIANEGGGHFLLGISNDPPRPVVGTNAFREPVKMEAKLFQILGFRVDIEEVAHPDGPVLVFHVPSRPTGTAYHHKGQYLMRSGESLVPMSEDQLRKIFNEGKPNWLEEHTVKSLLPEEVVKLLDVNAYFSLLKLPAPTDDLAAVARLESDGLVDGSSGTYAIRRIGALLLATRLDKFPELERRGLRIIVYNDTSKLDTKLERQSVRGYAVGFRRIVSFIGEQLPQNEVIENAIRKEVKLVPEAVIRELVANALIHQDFEISGTSAMVEIYSDRVEISNPGIPAIPADRFIDGCRSRNEHLAMVMRKLGICEEKGSGIDRVVHAAEVYQLPAPNFHAGYQSTVVTIFGLKDFEEMGRDDRIRACYQHCALRYVTSQQMTNQSLRERFNLPEAKSVVISQIISATIETGLIKPDEKVGGSRKFARYLPFWA